MGDETEKDHKALSCLPCSQVRHMRRDAYFSGQAEEGRERDLEAFKRQKIFH